MRLGAEQKQRADRLHKGLLGVWELLTGKARAIRRLNEEEAYKGYTRDREQRERLHLAQVKERSALQKRIDAVGARHREERMRLARRIVMVMRHTDEAVRRRERTIRSHGHSRDYDLER